MSINDGEIMAMIERHEAITAHLDAIRQLVPEDCKITLLARYNDGGELALFLSDDDLDDVARTLEKADEAEMSADPFFVFPSHDA